VRATRENMPSSRSKRKKEKERERETERDRQTDRETDTDRDRENESHLGSSVPFNSTDKWLNTHVKGQCSSLSSLTCQPSVGTTCYIIRRKKYYQFSGHSLIHSNTHAKLVMQLLRFQGICTLTTWGHIGKKVVNKIRTTPRAKIGIIAMKKIYVWDSTRHTSI
jgi:hypothetical protein